MNNIVLIGAGQTGRGYLNRFFQLSQRKVIFLDKDKELIDRLNQQKAYTISFGVGKRAPLVCNNYEAYQIDSEAAEEALKAADLVMISVGQKNLKSLVSLLEKAWRNRKRPLDVLTAENGVQVKKELLSLCKNEHVHLAESIVFCTTLKQEGTLDILSEDLDYLPYDAVSLGHQLPFENMIAEDDLDVLMQRKIYTYNCISACIAYLGYYKSYQIYSEAANDEEIDACIREILTVLNECVANEYHVKLEEQIHFSQMAVQKFQNKAIVDTIERNARDVDRKLGPSERILAPLNMIRKHKKECRQLLLAAAAAIYYGEKTNTLVKPASAYFAKLPQNWQETSEAYLEMLRQNKLLTGILSI